MAKRPFMSGYRTYDPAVEGYGNARDWRATFRSAMGLEEATRRMGATAPETVLGLPWPFTADQLKSAYRKAARASHPDLAATLGLSVAEATERFKQVQAAFVLLSDPNYLRTRGRRQP